MKSCSILTKVFIGVIVILCAVLIIKADSPATNKSVYVQFNPDSSYSNTIYWQNGRPGITIELTHNSVGLSNVNMPDAKECYGPHLTLYVFNNRGTSNYYNGSYIITIGDADTGRIFLGHKLLRCGDITISLQITNITYYSNPTPKYRSKGFEGAINVEVQMDEGN